MLLLLSACISSEGIMPQSDVPVDNTFQLSEYVQEIQEDAAWPIEQWWQCFQDEQLNQLMQLAVSQSPSVQEAQARIRLATSLAAQTDATLSPTMDAEVQINRKRWPTDYFYGPGELGGTTSWNNTGLLSLHYDPDIWNKNSLQSEVALSEIKKQTAKSQIAKLNIESALMSSYIELSLNHDELELAQQAVNTYQEKLDVIKAQLKMGLNTEVAVHQAETQLADAEAKLEAVKDHIVIAKHAIAALLGEGPAFADSLKPPHLTITEEVSLPSHIPAELLGHRPDVVASRWLVFSANKHIDIAHTAFYPNINLSAAIGFMAVNGSVLSVFSHDKLTYDAGPAISLPIFDAGRIRGELSEATASYDMTVALYKKTLTEAMQQIADSAVSLKSSLTQSATLASAIKASHQAYLHANDAYEVGLTDYLPVLEAKLVWLQQQLFSQQINAQVLQYRADLIIALGGGLTTEDDGPKQAALRYQEKP
ncbi:efflux transporter outer membrane subunit [Methylophaga thalassica]|nr:efflux transporter outer membrane subunit [Methylophaga aminisulfidivorans]